MGLWQEVLQPPLQALDSAQSPPLRSLYVRTYPMVHIHTSDCIVHVYVLVYLAPKKGDIICNNFAPCYYPVGNTNGSFGYCSSVTFTYMYSIPRKGDEKPKPFWYDHSSMVCLVCLVRTRALVRSLGAGVVWCGNIAMRDVFYADNAQ